jgi:hypothetical protein
VLRRSSAPLYTCERCYAFGTPQQRANLQTWCITLTVCIQTGADLVANCHHFLHYCYVLFALQAAGLTVCPLALLFMLYSLHTYSERIRMVTHGTTKSNTRAYAVYGPCIITVLLIAVFIIATVSTKVAV